MGPGLGSAHGSSIGEVDAARPHRIIQNRLYDPRRVLPSPIPGIRIVAALSAGIGRLPFAHRAEAACTALAELPLALCAAEARLAILLELGEVPGPARLCHAR